MGVVDPGKICAKAEQELGPLVEGPATWGVLPEGAQIELKDRSKQRLARSEPCLFLGPPRRSKLVLAVAILDPSELALDPVRLYATISIAELAGLWMSGLEDAVSRFPPGSVARDRPELLVLREGSLVWRLGEKGATGLPRFMPAIAIGREVAPPARRAIVLVRATRQLDPAYFQDRRLLPPRSGGRSGGGTVF